MKLFHLCCFWLCCAVAPLYAGDWWDADLNFWQSATSFAVLVAVLSCYRTWWALAFACVCVWQIAINGYDATVGIEYVRYNTIQDILTLLEFLLLFGAGFMELKGAYERYRDAHSAVPRSNSHS